MILSIYLVGFIIVAQITAALIYYDPTIMKDSDGAFIVFVPIAVGMLWPVIVSFLILLALILFPIFVIERFYKTKDDDGSIQ